MAETGTTEDGNGRGALLLVATALSIAVVVELRTVVGMFGLTNVAATLAVAAAAATYLLHRRRS